MITENVKQEKKLFVIRKPKDQYYDVCLSIIGGVQQLTKQERDILKAMIKVYNEASKDGSVITDLLTRKVREQLKNSLRISSSNLNNYIVKLKKKGVIKETTMGFTIIPQLLIPEADVMDVIFRIDTTK